MAAASRPAKKHSQVSAKPTNTILELTRAKDQGLKFMSFMIEFYYHGLRDPAREQALAEEARRFHGLLECREDPEGPSQAVCLSFEFADMGSAA
jgi:hypothetical protein